MSSEDAVKRAESERDRARADAWGALGAPLEVANLLGCGPRESPAAAARRVVSDNAALGVGFALLVREVGQFIHAEACEVEDDYDADDLNGCKCALRFLPDARAVLSQSQPGDALLEKHRKELKRARNEGLEKAEAHCRARAEQMKGFTARSPSRVVLSVADEICCLKGPE